MLTGNGPGDTTEARCTTAPVSRGGVGEDRGNQLSYWWTLNENHIKAEQAGRDRWNVRCSEPDPESPASRNCSWKVNFSFVDRTTFRKEEETPTFWLDWKSLVKRQSSLGDKISAKICVFVAWRFPLFYCQELLYRILKRATVLLWS